MTLRQQTLQNIRAHALEDYAFAHELNRYPELLFDLLHTVPILHRLRDDPVFFCSLLLGIRPLSYQVTLLRDFSKRQAVRQCRQSGKTYILGAKALWFSLFGFKRFYPDTSSPTAIIVSPSLRQSIIFRDKLEPHIQKLTRSRLRRLFISRALRQTIYFRNGGKLVALPNSPDMIRGETAHLIICDETAMLRDDEYLLDQVLDPMLATTDGFLIASSTPKGKGSYFWRICKGAFSSEYSQHWITWREPVEEGLISRGFMQKRLELVEAGLVSRHTFQMEFEAEFVEDTDSWLPYDLITQCIDSERDDPYYDFDHRPEGEFYMGVDLGKKRDHSVIHVVQRQGSVLSLVHKKKFPLESPYASVIGYIKVLRDRADRLRRIYMDQTGVGEYIVEDTRRSLDQGPKDERLVVGVVLTLPKKEAIATHLKTVMENQRTWNRHTRAGKPIPEVVERHDGLLIPYDSELIDELSVEKWELTKAGRVQFSHPEGTHDDEFWALALACAASREKARRAVIRKI